MQDRITSCQEKVSAMHPLLFGVIFLLLNMVLLGMAIACVVASYKTVWHLVGVLKRKERLAFDWQLFIMAINVFLLLMIVIIWPLALYFTWHNLH